MPWSDIDTLLTGELVTAAMWTKVKDDMAFLERVGYAERTTDLAITQTAVANAQDLFSTGAITYEAVLHEIRVFIPRLSAGDGVFDLILKDGNTVVGTLLAGVASTSLQAVKCSHVLTPSAGSHTYKVAGWRGGTTDWNVRAGTGGSAGDATTFFPAWMDVRRVAT
jgi:hypothetical protein